MSEENKRMVKQSFDAINAKDHGKMRDQLDPKFQEVFADVAKRAQAAFPDMRLKIEDQIAEGDKVATRWSLEGKHSGNSSHSRLGNVRATNKKVRITGITIHRIKNGRIVESWGSTDKLEALEQLGLVDDFARSLRP